MTRRESRWHVTVSVKLQPDLLGQLAPYSPAHLDYHQRGSNTLLRYNAVSGLGFIYSGHNDLKVSHICLIYDTGGLAADVA